ncbi:MAG: hypothetical protein Q8L51_04025, partial [Candidatus Amesbacteria bacterium]|nr:hypothetical protein [Candidatus Amesbacteria bacterium]
MVLPDPNQHPYFRQLTAIISVFVLTAGLGLAVQLAQNRQNPFSKAESTGTATLSLSPTLSVISAGQTVTHAINLNTAGVPISTFAFRLNYPILPVLTIKPEFNSNGWSCPVKTVTLVNTQYQVDVSCVFISTEGFSTATPVTVASVNTTTSSSFTVEFDALQTLITRKSDAVDIAAIPASPASIVTVAVALASPTPTPTPTPSATPLGASPIPSPTPGATNSCGGTCGSNSNCNAGLTCYSGFCRNPQCKENKDCNCATTPVRTPTPTPYKQIVNLKPTPTTATGIMTKPTPKTDMRIYNLDLETPAPTPAPKEQSLFTKVVGF